MNEKFETQPELLANSIEIPEITVDAERITNIIIEYSTNQEISGQNEDNLETTKEQISELLSEANKEAERLTSMLEGKKVRVKAPNIPESEPVVAFKVSPVNYNAHNGFVTFCLSFNRNAEEVDGTERVESIGYRTCPPGTIFTIVEDQEN